MSPMKRRPPRLLALLLALMLLAGCGAPHAQDAAPPRTPDLSAPETPETSETPQAPEESEAPDDGGPRLLKSGLYTSKDDVARYLRQFGALPENFITKAQAKELGWPGGSLEPYAPGMCIGGDRFGNYEELLPKKDGRTYQECDIDTLGADSRGAKRIVFSSDGLIYYTDDHYASFTLLYGDEDA